jgi:Zn-dependent M28 family amino/carboxypeptidase
MSHKSFRLVSVVAVVFVLTFALLPSAEARGLSGSRATVHNPTDWFGAAMAWMADLLNPGHGGPAGLRHPSGASTTITVPNGSPRYSPNTGACIDPMGGSTHCAS